MEGLASARVAAPPCSCWASVAKVGFASIGDAYVEVSLALLLISSPANSC